MNLSRVEEIANELMTQHGLTAQGWTFMFDPAKKRFGKCDYEHKVIQMSYHFANLNTEEVIRQNLLHEISHALTPGHHHDETWRRVARSIGDDGERCFSRGVVRPQLRFKAICPLCGRNYSRSRNTHGRVSWCKCQTRVANKTFLVWIDSTTGRAV